MTLGFAIDLLIVLLLAGTIGLCVVLHFRLKAFRDAQAEMIRLMEGFGQATERAEAGIAQLKAAGDEVGQRLNDGIRKARSLADELSFLLDGGNRALDGMAERAPTVRPTPARPVAAVDVPQAANAGGVRPQPRAVPSGGNASGRVAAHAAYARSLVERRDGRDEPIDTDRRDATGARTDAERELLEMLRQAR